MVVYAQTWEVFTLKKLYRATLIILYWSTSTDIDYFYEKTVWKNKNDKNFYLQKEKKSSYHSVSTSNGNFSFDLVYSYPISIYA